MPWYLALDLVSDPIDWSFSPTDPKPYAYDNPVLAPRDTDVGQVFTLVVHDNHQQIPDISMLNGNAAIVVSQAFRDLVEAMDPVVHHYLPVRIVLKNGSVVEGSYYLFKFGAFVEEGLDPDRSDVAPLVIGGKLRRYQSRSLTPNLMWRGSKIAGRHIWADEYLPKFIAVSDEFYARIKAAGMKDFVSKESRVDSKS